MFVTCKEGAMIDGVQIPPFMISKGDVLSLTWPRLAYGREEQNFLSVLRREKAVNGLVVNTTAAIANPYDEHYQEIVVSDLHDIESLLENIHREYRDRFISQVGDPVSSLPATMCALVSVHKACYESEFVVFTSSGLDFLGEEELLGFVYSKAARGWGFLYLQFPLIPIPQETNADNYRAAVQVLRGGSG